MAVTALLLPSLLLLLLCQLACVAVCAGCIRVRCGVTGVWIQGMYNACVALQGDGRRCGLGCLGKCSWAGCRRMRRVLVLLLGRKVVITVVLRGDMGRGARWLCRHVLAVCGCADATYITLLAALWDV